MRELTRSNDLVWLSWLSALLADAGIEIHLLDAHMSALEGSVIAIERRVMVADEDYDEACRLLTAARAPSPSEAGDG
ncbi:MAG: DUF2007 domain-containing protein [Pseudomonadota bacterium]